MSLAPVGWGPRWARLVGTLEEMGLMTEGARCEALPAVIHLIGQQPAFLQQQDKAPCNHQLMEL